MKVRVALVAVAFAMVSFQRNNPNPSPDLSGMNRKIARSYAEIPLSFEVNEGQADASVKFLSRTSGTTILLAPTETVFSMAKPAAALRMQLKDANPEPAISGVDSLPGKANYFIGSDPQQWLTNVPTFSKVRYQDVYPGIDVVYYGNQRHLEYDFVVKPGADPRSIRFKVAGARDLELDPRGDLLLHLPDGDIRQHKPVVYQESNGTREELSGTYVLNGSDEVAFEVASYDPAKPLVIDPVVSYSTYFGSSDVDLPFAGIAIDSTGNAYIAGFTTSNNFPRTSPLQSSFAGGSGQFLGAPLDMFIAKINAAGSAVLYSTYLGGSGDDGAFSIAVDAAGNAYVTGLSDSTNFPITAGAYQTVRKGEGDVTITKINPAGSALVYSTYLGGRTFQAPHGVAVDAAGNVYVAGNTESSDFPTTTGAYQQTRPALGQGATKKEDAFITKFNAAGSALVYSTYLGGGYGASISGIVVDDSGNAYVTGETSSTNFPTTPGAFQSFKSGGAQNPRADVFVTKITPAGSALVYSTYIGGSDADVGVGIGIDASGNAYVAGETISTDFPTTSGALQRTYGGSTSGTNPSTGAADCDPLSESLCGDAFVTKLNTTGAGLVYSTYLGGSKADGAARIRVTSGGAVFVTGYTLSSNFPTATPIQAANASAATACTACADAFVTNLDASGALYYSTYFGGISPTSGDDRASGIAIDSEGTAYVTGSTNSESFPTTNPIQGHRAAELDAFIVKITGGTTAGGGTTGGGGGSTGGGGETGGGGSPGGISSSAYTVSNFGAASQTTTGAGTAVSVGYARIQPGTGNTTPSGVAIFGFRQNNILVSEAGVPASPLVTSGRIYAEVNGPVNTGLAIANPGSQSALINFYFSDETRTSFNSGTTTIAAGGQIAAFLNQAPFNGGSSISGTFTFSSSVPITVVALRGLTNERSEFLLTTLPLSTLSAPTGETAYFPHFADGGGWTTQVVLVNPTDDPMTGTVQFFGQGTTTVAGQPAVVTISGQTASTFNYTIPARSVRRLQTAGAGATIAAGSVRVVPSTGGKTPSGLIVFSFKNAGVTVAEAGVAAARTGLAFRMYAEVSDAASGSIQTGIAIANAASLNVSVTFELHTLSGGVTGITGFYSVPANGQVAMFLNQIPGFSGLTAPFQGVLRISTTAPTGISVVGLRGRTNERGDFLITTTPPVDEAIPPTTAELVFPHLADGGGYTTQFVLFSGAAGQSASGTLRFYAQNGQQLNLALH